MWVMPQSHNLAARVSAAWTISRPLGHRVAVEARAAGGGATHRLMLLLLHTSYVIHCNLTPLQHSRRARPSFSLATLRAVRYHAVTCTFAVVFLVNSLTLTHYQPTDPWYSSAPVFITGLCTSH